MAKPVSITPNTSRPAQGQPDLTEEQHARLFALFLMVELANRDTSPEVVARAITDLIQQRQASLQQAITQVHAFRDGVSVDGWALAMVPDQHQRFGFSRVAT